MAAGRIFIAVATVVENVDAGGFSENADSLPRSTSGTWSSRSRKAG
jgi:hypothetical protein